MHTKLSKQELSSIGHQSTPNGGDVPLLQVVKQSGFRRAFVLRRAAVPALFAPSPFSLSRRFLSFRGSFLGFIPRLFCGGTLPARCQLFVCGSNHDRYRNINASVNSR